MKNEFNIAERIREISERRVPAVTQETKPVRESINKDMVQCNFDIHPDLKRQMKVRSAETGLSFKEIITTAIQEYLK